MSAKSQLDNESGKKTNGFVSGVRRLAVMFSSAFRKSANDESLHELDKQAVQKVELNFSSKFIKRIAKLKSSEGRGRGQLTGMYMQYVLERVVREYYQVTLPSSEVSEISDQRVNRIRKKLDDNELDIKRHIRDYYDLSLNKLDPVAPLLIYVSRSSIDSGGNHLRTLYKYLKKKEYDLLTEYREKIFGCLTRELKVDKIISEYSVSGLNCRGRIDIFCGELLIDSKCTVRNDFHVDLSQLLLYKLLVQECSSNIVKQVMIVNPCLNYVYIVNVEHWKGAYFREVLDSHQLNRSVSTPNLIPDSQRQRKNITERDKGQDNENSLTKENITLIDQVHDLGKQNIADNKETWKKLKALSREEWDRLCADSKNRYISVAKKLIDRGETDHLERLEVTDREIAEVKAALILQREQRRKSEKEQTFKIQDQSKSLTQKNVSLQNQVNSLTQEVKDLNLKIDQLVTKHKRDMSKMQRRIDKLEEESETSQEKIIRLEEENIASQKKIAYLQSLVQKCTSACETMNSVRDEFASFIKTQTHDS